MLLFFFIIQFNQFSYFFFKNSFETKSINFSLNVFGAKNLNFLVVKLCIEPNAIATTVHVKQMTL